MIIDNELDFLLLT